MTVRTHDGHILYNGAIPTSGSFAASPATATVHVSVALPTSQAAISLASLPLDDISTTYHLSSVTFGADNETLAYHRIAEVQASSTGGPPPRVAIERAVQTVFSRLGSSGASHDPSWSGITQTFAHDSRGVDALDEYADATNLNHRVDDVRGETASITTTYITSSDSKDLRLSFLRHDTWTFAHVAAGWLLEGLRVDDLALTAVAFGDGTKTSIRDSSFDPSSRNVTYHIEGYKLVWHPVGGDGMWRVDVLSSPRPQPSKITWNTPHPSTITWNTPQPSAPAPPQVDSFHGFSCKGTCEGHQRGYDWAEKHQIDDPHACYSGPRLSNPNNESFSEGCEAYVDDSTGAARLDPEERYGGDENTQP